MKKYIYLVHGLNDPIEGNDVQFNYRDEAIECAKNYEGASVEMVELDGGALTGFRLPIYGPEVDKIVNSSDEYHNSCRDIDCPEGSEMNPTSDEDLFDRDDLENEGYDDRRNHDPINRRERVNMELNETLYNDTDIDWKEPDPNTTEITYCREYATVGGPINISAGFSVDFVTESGVKVYVGADLEEVSLWQDKDYEVDFGKDGAATVTLLKPIDQIFNFDIETFNLDYDDVTLSDMIDKMVDSDSAFDEQKAAQEEFFAYQLSTDKNILNKVKELLEKRIYRRTSFKEDAIKIAKYNLDESLKKEKLTESDNSDLDTIESIFKSRFSKTASVNESLTEEAGDEFSRIESAFNAKFGNLENDFEENLDEDLDSEIEASSKKIKDQLIDFANKFDKLNLGK